MAIETQTKIINGDEYMVTQYGARLGGRIQIRLAKLIGPFLAGFLGGLILDKGDKEKSLMNMEINPEAIQKAIENLVGTLEEKDWDSLVIPMIVNFVRKNTKEIKNEQVFDQEFAGDYMTLYKLLYFIVEVNFGCFFNLANTGKD